MKMKYDIAGCLLSLEKPGNGLDKIDRTGINIRAMAKSYCPKIITITYLQVLSSFNVEKLI